MFADVATGASNTSAASSGYDVLTGLGTPHAGALVNELTDL